MALGELAKEFARQAIAKPAQEMLAETLSGAKPASPPPQPQPPEGAGPVILGQVQAMQRALKEDEELQVFFCGVAGQTVRVVEIIVPAWNVLVLNGLDADKVVTRVVAPVESVTLVCKLVKLGPGGKPVTVRLITPKPKSE